MTTATTFSRKNDAGSRSRTTYYWENLVLVVVLVLESKGLYSYSAVKIEFESQPVNEFSQPRRSFYPSDAGKQLP